MATYAGFAKRDFRWTTEAPTVFRSSQSVQRTFCGTCGAPLAYECDGYPDEIHLVIGAFDHPDSLPPIAHVHVSDKIAWMKIADDLPRFDGGSGELADLGAG